MPGATKGKVLAPHYLGDALLRTARVELGVFAMLVDAKDDAAQRFYEHYGLRYCRASTDGCACRSLKAFENWLAEPVMDRDPAL